MQALASLEVYAARAWAIRNPYPDGRHRLRLERAPAGRDARAGAGARDTARAVDLRAPTGTAAPRAKACSPTGAYTWCQEAVAGARFNPGWTTFESW